MKVRVENVSFAYGREPVLSDVSLQLVEGGISVVIGPSGSGKSTLVQLLAGLLHPDEGRISFDFKLREGVVTKSNALALMRSIGLDV